MFFRKRACPEEKEDGEEELELFVEPRLNPLQRFLRGVKVTFGVLLGLPFLLVLIPAWFIHVWNERRLGNPPPIPPWDGLFGPRRQVESHSPAAVSVEERWRESHKQRRHAAPFIPDTSPVWSLAPEAPGQRGVALVTGGAKRMGEAMCRELARLGFRVAIGYRESMQEALDLAEALQAEGYAARPIFVELRDSMAMENFVQQAREELGPITLLVNNAALFAPTPLADGTWEGMENLLRINLLAPLWLSVLAGRVMVEGGLIINMADIWGERPLSEHAAYCASKAGLIMATRALARDLAPAIRVNAIAPGAILARDDSPAGEDGYRLLLHRTPLADHAGLEAVLQAMRYLLAAPYVTGEVLHVDGGRRWVS